MFLNELCEGIDRTQAVNGIVKLIRDRGIEFQTFDELQKFIYNLNFLKPHHNDQQYMMDVARFVLRRLHDEKITESENTVMMAKLARTGKIVRIIRKQHEVKFSNDKNWLLVDTDPGKGNRGQGLKWIPASTDFEWVRPYLEKIDETVDYAQMREQDIVKVAEQAFAQLYPGVKLYGKSVVEGIGLTTQKGGAGVASAFAGSDTVRGEFYLTLNAYAEGTAMIVVIEDATAGQYKSAATAIIQALFEAGERLYKTESRELVVHDNANYEAWSTIASRIGAEIVDEDLNEGVGQWLAGIATVGAMLFGAPDANAITQQQYNQTAQMLSSAPAQILKKAAVSAGITGHELAQFMAQCAHETANFTSMKEHGGSLDFKKYDPKHNPRKAKALGNIKAGDGAKYHGRGYIQLTGRDNYKRAGQALGLPLEQHPELVEKPEVAARVAVWFWKSRVQPKVQSYTDTRQVTKPINPGMRGIQDREAKFQAIKQGAMVRANQLAPRGTKI